MNDRLDFSKQELLTEEELNEEKGKWTLDDWIAYYTKNGVMTHEEMRQYTLNLAYKMNADFHCGFIITTFEK